MFQKGTVDPEVVEDAGEKDHCHQNHQRLGGQRQPQVDVLAAEDNRERGAEGDEVHCPVGMEKDEIETHHGNRNQLKCRKFPDYGVAVGHHKRHRDQKEDDLSLSDLADLLQYLF